MLGTVEAARAFTTVHDGAIYLHQGRSYEVRELDLGARHALVEPFDGNWYTQPKKETDTHIERLLDRRDTLGVTLSFGAVSVTEQVMAYQRKRLGDHEVIDLQALDLPQTTFQTQALWYELGADVLAEDFPLDVLLGSLHAAEHSQIAVLPLLAMCDRWDIGGLSTNAHPQTGGPTIFIYDGHPGGVGHHPPGLPRLRDARRRRAPPGQRVPVRVGLPVLRAVAEVREPQRAAQQGGLRRGDGADAGTLDAVAARAAGRLDRGHRLRGLRAARGRRSTASRCGSRSASVRRRSRWCRRACCRRSGSSSR